MFGFVVNLGFWEYLRLKSLICSLFLQIATEVMHTESTLEIRGTTDETLHTSKSAITDNMKINRPCLGNCLIKGRKEMNW